ncbi:hypothetical protein SESBI_35824 [Sesbania bispinosa]|nr:hypothetical protein SESBI_35824 [Sesbania bispinosa]
MKRRKFSSSNTSSTLHNSSHSHNTNSSRLLLRRCINSPDTSLDEPPTRKFCNTPTMLSKEDQLIGGEEDENSVVELPGIPLAPHSHSQSSKDGVYFILEKASLTTAYVGKKYHILNPDEHGSFLRRKNRKNMNPYDFRPDIVHEALLQIMSSRLRMAGRLRAVFIRTDEGILIRVEPQTQIPKTLGSFCNMMAELLQNFSIKSKGNQGKLLRLIQNPVTQHLPVNSYKIGLSFSSSKTVKLRDFSAANCDKNLVFVVGAMAHGKIDADYIDDLISGS